MERLVLARLNFTANQLQLIPRSRVGFREGRSVEDNLGRLIQEVQDGWNRPKSRRKDTPDGHFVQKYALLAFDFSRAYDTVDHRLLRARLLDQGLPGCLVQWVWTHPNHNAQASAVGYQHSTHSNLLFFGAVLKLTSFVTIFQPDPVDLKKSGSFEYA